MHPIDILFWTCLIFGGAYTVVTLLMGGFSHVVGHVHAGDLSQAGHLGGGAHVGHIDIGHAGHADVGHVGHADAGHVGHADAAHAGHGHAEVDHGHHAEAEEGGGRFSILAYLNPMSIAGFLLGFGGLGVTSRLLGSHVMASLLMGTAGGLGLWLLAYWVATCVFAASEGTSENKREELIGLRGNVTAPIAAGHPGMVSYVVSGSRQSIRAITDDPDPIPVGATIRIRRIEAATAHVVRVDAMGELPEARLRPYGR